MLEDPREAIREARRELHAVIKEIQAVPGFEGCGFSRAQVPDGGFGLVGMRERIASVNGALDLESEWGAGTRLTIEIS